MAQKFSFRPGIAKTRSFGAPALSQKSAASCVGRERVAGDFRAAEDGEVEFFERNAEPIAAK